MAGTVTEEVVLVGTETSLATLSEAEHREALGELTAHLGHHMARGMVGGVREGLEAGLSGSALEADVARLVDGALARMADGLESRFVPLVGVFSATAVEHMLEAVLGYGAALEAMFARVVAHGVDAAMARVARGLEREVVPALARALEAHLVPALSRGVEQELGPALARTLEHDLGPALATVLRRDLVGALEDPRVHESLVQISYAIGNGMARGVQDAIDTGRVEGTDTIDIHEIGENLDYISYWVLAAIGIGIILMVVLIVGMVLRIVQGVREGMMENGSTASPHPDPHGTMRRETLLEVLLLSTMLRQGGEGEQPELRAALEERLLELRRLRERPHHGAVLPRADDGLGEDASGAHH